MKYSILCKHHDGSISYITHRNRTSWCIRAARKHLHDCVSNKLNKGMYDHVDYFACVLN